MAYFLGDLAIIEDIMYLLEYNRQSEVPSEAAEPAEPAETAEPAESTAPPKTVCYGCLHDLENQEAHYGGCISLD